MPSTWLSDIRFTFRNLRRSLAFTTVAVLALGLGIGANTAIFSGVNALLLGPLPYSRPEQLVALWEDASAIRYPHSVIAPANFLDWQKMNHVFGGMAALRPRTDNLTDGEKPEVAEGDGVTANFFEVLGVRPVFGRTFSSQEDSTGAKVVVISYGLWQRRFNGSRTAVGQTLHMNNEPFTVIGVMPPGFAFPNRDAEFWNPIRLAPAEWGQRYSHFLQVVARLKASRSLAEAQADMSAVAFQLERAYPTTNGKLGAVVVPLRDDLVGDTRTAFLVLLVASGTVLLIACANVANLLLIRGAERQRELAVRAAVGASRGQLIRQLLIESLILSGAGALVGLFLATLGMTALQVLIPAKLVNASPLSLNVPVLCFALGVSLVSGVLFGLLPALQSSRLDLNTVLKQGGRTLSGASNNFRRIFVVAQVSMALVLLAAAGLMIQTLANLRAVELGFPTDNLLTMKMPLSPQAYQDNAKILSFTDRVTEQISALPGVRGAAFASTIPFTSIYNSRSFSIEGRPSSLSDEFDDALYRPVSASYLQTLGARLRSGRLLDRRDTPTSQRVVVINETFARQYWPKDSPLGARIRIGKTTADNPLRTVVGVAADIRERGLQWKMKPTVYLPFTQVDERLSADYLIVRAAANSENLANSIRQAIWSVDPEQPVTKVQTMREYVDLELNSRGNQMKIFMIFAGLALFLAALGIYGVLAYSVEQRRREIGVRVALGANAVNVTGLVLRQGLALSVVGIVIGLALSVASTRAMGSLLFEVKPVDAPTFSLGVAVLFFSAMAACLIPAMSAARVDPMVALRNE